MPPVTRFFLRDCFESTVAASHGLASGAGAADVGVGLNVETGGDRCEDWRVDVEATEISDGGAIVDFGACKDQRTESKSASDA